MSEIHWAIRVERKFANRTIMLRHLPSARACEDADSDYLWVKGTAFDEAAFQQLDLLFRSITTAIRYRVTNDDQLIRIGDRLASAKLPSGEWRALSDCLKIDLPTTSLVGQTDQCVDIHFQRGGPVVDLKSTKPTLLRCDLAALSDWADTASETRLKRLTFACNVEKKTLLRGTPLPPIRGERWIEYQNIAVPVGWTWFPAVSIQALNQIFNATDNHLILVEESGCWQKIDRQFFAKASRIAIRTTQDQVDSRGLQES